MKRFSKTLLICLAVIAILAVALTGCSHSVGKELLVNGNFEKINSSTNRLEGWEFVYVKKDGEVDKDKNYETIRNNATSDQAKKFGDRYISITTSDYDTAYMKTTVKLYAGQLYCLSFDYNVSGSISSADGNNNAIGGYVGFLEDKNFKEFNVFSSTSWINRVAHNIYFRPTSTAKYTLVVGIGREDLGGSRGTIEFDNISVKAIKSIPAGSGEEAKLTPGSAVTDNEVGGVVYTVILCLFAVALVAGSYYLIRFLQRRYRYANNTPLFESEESQVAKGQAVKAKMTFKQFFEPTNLKKTFTSPIAIFVYTLLATFFIRFILVLTVFGLGDTIVEYGNIALTIAHDGPAKLYSSLPNTNLETGWLYLLSFFGVIGKALDFTEKSIGMSMLIRIPNIIADLAVCYTIYKIIASNYNHKYSAVIAGTYAVLPAMFTTSVTWGMNMSIALAFIVAMINFMLEKKYVYVPIMYTLGLFFSNFMLIALPVVIGYEIFYCIKDKKAILPIVIASIASFVVFYCLAIPFATNYFVAESEIKGGALVFTKMLENIKANSLISNSSFNFYAIFGLGTNSQNVAMNIIVALIMILFVIFGVYLYTKTRNRLDYVLLLSMSFIIWSVFGVGSRIEFTLIGVVLLLLYAGLKMEKRVFRVFGILSVTNFVNTSVILTKSGAINYAILDGTGLSFLYKLDPFYIIGSLITVFTVGYMIWVMYDIMANGVEREITALPNNLIVEWQDSITSKTNKMIRFFKRK